MDAGALDLNLMEKLYAQWILKTSSVQMMNHKAFTNNRWTSDNEYRQSWWQTRGIKMSKAVNQTDKKAEYYRAMVVSQATL